MKIVLNVTKKPFKFPWKFCLCRHAWINQWFHNKSCLLWWPVSLSTRIQTTLNHILFVLYHNIKDNERNLCFKICWQLKTPTARAALCKWATCTRQLSFQELLQTRSTCRSNKKTLFGKRVMSVRVQTTKPHFDLFLPGMDVKQNVFS